MFRPLKFSPSLDPEKQAQHLPHSPELLPHLHQRPQAQISDFRDLSEMRVGLQREVDLADGQHAETVKRRVGSADN